MQNSKTEYAVAVERGDYTTEQIVDGARGRSLSLTFPVQVKQVGPKTIEIELQRGPDPFNEQFTKHCVELLGAYRAEAFLDEYANRLSRALITENIR